MSQRRVLIADDDDAIRGMLYEFLHDEGFTVLTATNGEEAITHARSSLPDCILMDLNMPIMDGVLAIRELKRDDQTKAIPVYAMSARSIIMANAKELLADGTLQKPFDLWDVLTVVREANGRQDQRRHRKCSAR